MKRPPFWEKAETHSLPDDKYLALVHSVAIRESNDGQPLNDEDRKYAEDYLVVYSLDGTEFEFDYGTCDVCGSALPPPDEHCDCLQ